MTRTELLKIAYDIGYEQALKQAGLLDFLRNIGKAKEAIPLGSVGKNAVIGFDAAGKPIFSKAIETTQRTRGPGAIAQAQAKAKREFKPMMGLA